MVLEKTLESPLECKENQPVHPKGDQSWVFIGRTDVEAETPVLWPPDVKNWLICKDPDAGKDWGQEEKGTTEDEMVEWHHRLNGHGFGRTPGVGDEQGGLLCCVWFMGSQRVRHDWATELNWPEKQKLHLSIHLRVHRKLRSSNLFRYSRVFCMYLTGKHPFFPWKCVQIEVCIVHKILLLIVSG